MTNIAIENGHRDSGFTPFKTVIFHRYVQLPEGTVYGHSQVRYEHPSSGHHEGDPRDDHQSVKKGPFQSCLVRISCLIIVHA